MKKILFLSILTFCFSINLSAKKNKDTIQSLNPFEFSYTDTSSETKSNLYIKANEWVANTFNSAKDVIQMNDKEAGKIIAKGVIECFETAALSSITIDVKFTLAIDVKDKKYRIRLYDFLITYISIPGNPYSPFQPNTSLSEDKSHDLWPKNFRNVKYKCYDRANELLTSFKAGMKKSDKSDW